MRLIRINESEAILEAFFTGDQSADGAVLSPLDRYRVQSRNNAVVSPTGSISLPDSATLLLETDANLELGEFDRFLLFTSLPAGLHLHVTARLNGRLVNLLQIEGSNGYKEHEAHFPGGRLTSIRLEFINATPGPKSGDLSWFGVANSQRQAEMISRPPAYDASWPGLLRESGDFRPHLNLVLSAGELPALRAKLATGPLARSMDALRAQAREDLSMDPEREIGEFIAMPNPRFCRQRDLDRRCTIGTMERLAFAGLIDKNEDMLRLAARMALSAAHCTHWCESFMGHLPGSTWHHRSFAEAWTAFSVALTLDWAGEFLTPPGRALIRDALHFKALARLEADFHQWEYIRGMNQGLFFSGGRILSLLALAGTFPRYVQRLEEAESDLWEMVDNYIQEDGGSREGTHYGTHVISILGLPLLALARAREKSLRDYARPRLRNAADFALGMLSTQAPGHLFLPVNAVFPGESIEPRVAAIFALLSGDPCWSSLHALCLTAEKPVPDVGHLLLAPEVEDLVLTPTVKERFDVFPLTGQASSVRSLTGGGFSHFHLCSGDGRGGHSHEDKGSFILEARGEVLLLDRGVCDYADPRHKTMSLAENHNLLCPLDEHGVPLQQTPRTSAGGRLLEVENDPATGCFHVTSDHTAAWPGGIFARNRRRVLSPTADLFLIEDEIELHQPMPLDFRLHSHYEFQPVGAGWILQAPESRLQITPLNWHPHGRCSENGVDGQFRPVHTLSLSIPKTCSTLLKTELRLLA